MISSLITHISISTHCSLLWSDLLLAFWAPQMLNTLGDRVMSVLSCVMSLVWKVHNDLLIAWFVSWPTEASLCCHNKMFYPGLLFRQGSAEQQPSISTLQLADTGVSGVRHSFAAHFSYTTSIFLYPDGFMVVSQWAPNSSPPMTRHNLLTRRFHLSIKNTAVSPTRLVALLNNSLLYMMNPSYILRNFDLLVYLRNSYIVFTELE